MSTGCAREGGRRGAHSAWLLPLLRLRESSWGSAFASCTYVSNGWPVAMPAAPPIEPASRCEMTLESIDIDGDERRASSWVS